MTPTTRVIGPERAQRVRCPLHPLVVPHLEEAMHTVEVDVKAIHPSRGAKYSPNLHKWLTARGYRHRARTSSVFRDRDGTLWIGMLDEGLFLLGCRLMSVLCNGTKAESMAYPLKQLGPLEEVADFWARYATDGRCAIDTEHQMHFVGNDTRWRTAGDERECMWCGKAHQRRERYTRTAEHERWVMGHNAGITGRKERAE